MEMTKLREGKPMGINSAVKNYDREFVCIFLVDYAYWEAIL